MWSWFVGRSGGGIKVLGSYAVLNELLTNEVPFISSSPLTCSRQDRNIATLGASTGRVTESAFGIAPLRAPRSETLRRRAEVDAAARLSSLHYALYLNLERQETAGDCRETLRHSDNTLQEAVNVIWVIKAVAPDTLVSSTVAV